MMRTRFTSDLDSIKEMSQKINELIIISYDRIDLYLDKGNKENLEQVIDLYEDIRRAANDLERLCFELLALQQPVAKDLRFIQMEIKLASTQKRIASHLVSAAEILQNFAISEKESSFIKAFISNQKTMAADGIDAFVSYDKDKARKIMDRDEINNKIFVDAISFAASENKSDRIGAVELANKILLFKYFERLGDRLARISDLATRL